MTDFVTTTRPQDGSQTTATDQPKTSGLLMMPLMSPMPSSAMGFSFSTGTGSDVVAKLNSQLVQVRFSSTKRRPKGVKDFLTTLLKALYLKHYDGAEGGAGQSMYIT